MSKLKTSFDLFLFKGQEVPMWENSPDGGVWILKVRKEDNLSLMWESLLLALIGEHFGETGAIGANISFRTRDVLLQVWLKDARDPKVKAQASNRIRHCLKLDPTVCTLYFKAHQNSIKDQSTMKNALGYKFEKKSKESEEISGKRELQRYQDSGYQKRAIDQSRKYNQFTKN